MGSFRRYGREGSTLTVSIKDKDGTVELLQGSIKGVSYQDGDLLVIRIADMPSDEYTRRRLQEIVRYMIRDDGRRLTAIIVPATWDLDCLPHDMAVNVLRTIIANKQGDPNAD